jgi:hypothetical protein
MNQSVSMGRRIKPALALAILFGFALPVKLSAQVVGATVSGRVVDPSGAVAPGASISIENVATGTIANGVTNAVGLYTVPNIQPGTYELKASARGFATEVRSGITLTVGEELVLNLTLKVGSSSQSVTVTSDAPTVDLANSTLGGINNTTTVTELL